MINNKFKFSPKFELVMSNLKIIKEINEVHKTEGKTEMLKFLKYIGDNLKEIIPDIQSWELDIEGDTIDIYPNDQWKVSDENICISIEISFKPLNSNSWIGLYVPDNWSQSKQFIEKLSTSLPKGFIEEWDEPEDEFPILSYIEYENYANGESFDYIGYIDDITEKIDKILKIKDNIDNNIKQILSEKSI